MMTDATHTPAPWRTVTDGISHWIEIEPNKIALIRAKKADRDLIAAAPDLLEALWQIVTDAEIDCDTEEAALAALADIRVTARNAIAKAKGA